MEKKIIFFLFLSPFSIYLLAVTSQIEGGTMETLCVTVNPSEPVSVEVNLEYNQKSITLLTEKSINQEYYHCNPFQVRLLIITSSHHLKGAGCNVYVFLACHDSRIFRIS